MFERLVVRFDAIKIQVTIQKPPLLSGRWHQRWSAFFLGRTLILAMKLCRMKTRSLSTFVGPIFLQQAFVSFWTLWWEVWRASACLRASEPQFLSLAVLTEVNMSIGPHYFPRASFILVFRTTRRNCKNLPGISLTHSYLLLFCFRLFLKTGNQNQKYYFEFIPQ